ncbi:Tetratricopeptide-like helical [Metarhizium album ARSEF 1941]|uniref:Tetratricopeptide-like helical n=1 Tax=Metarhizium album (strain ARSEF 1941) TaxID=1081103 RepID=A0A0B2X6W6_METAS|nr:Tetratricopeptide-like helical [Metarhizium album ARSEF 1941]KHO02139.1 Tetratricopeptide-like helical [Metarhizium album ARSEF 1941]
MPSTAPDSPQDSVKANHKGNPAILADFLSRPEEKNFHDVWDIYCRLDRSQKPEFCARVVIYLSASNGSVDTSRAISILRQIPMDKWDKKLQAAVVVLRLRSGDGTAAIDAFNTGLATRSCGAGFKSILEYAIINKEWPTALKVWLDYTSHLTRSNAGTSPMCADVPVLKFVPDLAKLYLSFEHYLEVEASGPVKAINLYENTRHGLRALRRWLAQQALRQPCSPQQAKTILQIWNDERLYKKYLLRMLRRWNDGLETRASLAALPEIYQQYRAMDHAKPPHSLLRQMFKFYHPSDAAGLAQIYADWHKAWGDLDQWGYERFMQFYSTTGHVPAVKDLWARYRKLLPEAAKTPQAFRAVMNVYAEIGDVEGAERELRVMTERHGVRPDISTWNTLLKCYSKTDDHARVFQCFEEIKRLDQPDSSTYAQVMTTAAKKGDLATTLDFYNQSQKAGVRISKEMAMALVMVYCHNERLVDAEKICTEFAERNVTSTAVWNQLIYFNGLQGKLNECYSILQSMTKYGVQWDHQTHEYLLRALGHANQVQQAYRLLQNARGNGLLPVGSEHFAAVMTGAVRTGQLDLAEAVTTHMRSAGFFVPFNAHVSLVEAAIRQNPSSHNTRVLAQGLVGHLNNMLQRTRFPVPEGGPDVLSGDTSPGLVELKKQTNEIGRAIALLVEIREFLAIEQLVTAYLDVFPEYKAAKYFPPEIASALMLGYLKEGKHDKVHDMWRHTLDAVLASGMTSGGTIYPASQYDLARPLNVVAKAYREANDGPGLLNTVEQLTNVGFKLTRANWNMCIRYLAELGHWERAMDWCEDWLMSRWRGWTPAATSLEERREMKNTRVLAASRATVFSLQKEWLKLRKLAAWSGDISSKLKDIEYRHPMLYHAFITTDYEHLPAAWVHPRKESMTKAMKKMLRPLTHDELKAMRKALEKQLRLERQRKTRKAVRPPFRVVPGQSRTHGEGLPRAFKTGGWKNLDAVLNKGLAAT